MKNKRRWGRSLLLSYLLSGAAEAGERHALLIGVGALPAMPRSSWLGGPTADVNAMHAALRQQGFADQHIYRLADDAGASQAPTRAAWRAWHSWKRRWARTMSCCCTGRATACCCPSIQARQPRLEDGARAC